MRLERQEPIVDGFVLDLVAYNVNANPHNDNNILKFENGCSKNFENSDILSAFNIHVELLRYQ